VIAGHEVRVTASIGVSDVIAESVETDAQRAFLLSGMATVNAQGYLYSRAVSPDEAVELIRRHTIPPAGSTGGT